MRRNSKGYGIDASGLLFLLKGSWIYGIQGVARTKSINKPILICVDYAENIFIQNYQPVGII